MSALPPIAEWQADSSWSAIDLLSDVHLHAEMPRTFEVWRDHLINTPADAVVMLGDLFEVWVGDDARFDGFEQRCCDVLREAARHRTLAFLPGNRDFLIGDEMLKDCGMRLLDDPTLLLAWQHRLLLSHGDALCVDDVDYQRFRAEVRSAAWQRQFLAQPLSQRQRQARAMREASAAHQASMAPSEWFDVNDAAADAWLDRARADALVHGHTHRPAAHRLPSGRSRYVMGDWDLDAASPRAQGLRLTEQGLSVLHFTPS